ncbi:alpha/beta fold hydrolase [Kordiimonas sp. SCSIO 12610]|uniref:alpha/beta fold hydrolase n=1 Tax=Kordiimonas sp. SCSIO 12610 TaxID=2829597 RepID=UPI00210871AA|nr:alpha/beta fold hydrolase [Kordiimonas sp. SCSIO 12610]UTW56732.1 alpha/beta fold hydrolase [Kordiimonas sp. SCSIO 12610]
MPTPRQANVMNKFIDVSQIIKRKLAGLTSFAALSLSVSLSAHALPLQTTGAGFTPVSETQCFLAGSTERLDCKTYHLPLDYSDPNGDTVEVFAAVMPSRGGKAAGDPLVLLAGGPGQAASEVIQLVDVAFGDLRNGRDVLIVDQRGTGRSHPISCKNVDSEIVTLEDYSEGVKACREAEPLPVRHFNFDNIIRDLEEIRASLGYEKLNLWGISWGTRSAAHYLRRYPDRVRSIVVDGVLPPQVPLVATVADSVERAKRLLVEDCEKSLACIARYPDIDGMINRLLDKAKSGDLVFDGINPLTNERETTEINFIGAVNGLHALFYNADATTSIPYMLDEALKGNLNPWLVFSFNASTDEPPIYPGSFLSIFCGEEMSKVTAASAKAAGSDSFAEDAHYQLWNAGCEAWDYVPAAEDSHEILESDVPTLVLSGNLDPITPPMMGDEWVKSFSNSRHIVVNGTGHNTSFTACMPGLITSFIKNLDVDALDTGCMDHLKRLPIITGPNATVQ